MMPRRLQKVSWPYPVAWNKTEQVAADVLVLGGGAAGCFAAIAAARRGARVVLVEKAATISSGAGGSGCDHWESAATNPCSRVSAEELTDDPTMAIDYKAICKKIIEVVENNRFNLIEAVAQKVLDVVLANPRVYKAGVEVDKPHALRFADSVSVKLMQENR